MPDSAVESSLASLERSAVRRRLPIGAEYVGDGRSHVRVWTPRLDRVEIVLNSRAISMLRDADGYFSALVDAAPGDRYQFRLSDDQQLYPDPASRFQPEGPHGPSEIVDPGAFKWTDGRIFIGQ